MSKFNRRSFLKAVGIGAGAAVGTRLAGPGFMPDAMAQNSGAGKPAVLVIYLGGGYNALFGSAASFMNTAFGVTAGNTAQVPGGPLVDASFNRLPKAAFDKISTVQINHRSSDHGGGQRGGQSEGGPVGFAIQLASSMGGDGTIKMATVGGGNVNGLAGTMNGTSIQNIGDARSTIDALKGNDTLADRAIAAKAIEQSQAMSAGRFAASPKGLTHLKDGYDTVRATLTKTATPYDYAAVLPGYGVTGTAINNFNSKIAAAELMIRAGANVVYAIDGGWDTHGDRDGSNVRNMMNTRIIPPLITFFNRMWVNNTEPVQRNVNVVIMGDFSRSLPGSDHATGCAATIIGANVKVGGFQRVTNNVGFDPNRPSGRGFFSLLGALTKTAGAPFGANAHPDLAV